MIKFSTFYDGERFISRLGNPFTPPDWFLESLSITQVVAVLL